MNSEISQKLGSYGLGKLNLDKILDAAVSSGATLAELFFEEVQSTRVVIEEKRTDQILEGIDSGVGLRVIVDDKVFYSYTTQIDQNSLERLAQEAAAAISKFPAKTGGAKPRTSGRISRDWAINHPTKSPMSSYQIAKPPREIDLTAKVAIAQRIEKAAWKECPEALQVMAVVGDSLRRVVVANSDGAISFDSKTYFQMVGQVVGKKGTRVESAHDSEGGYVGLEFLDKITPEKIGRTAAARVNLLLDASAAPSGTMPVVIAAEAGGTMVHEAVGHGLEADLACHGLSVYQGKVGQVVASPLVTVIDDGTIPELRGSYLYDDEGTPAQKNTLIEKGVLKGYMVDRVSALKFDLMATGNGRRETFRHTPMVRMTNTYIAAGTDDPAKILRDTEWGLFVKAMGGGQVDTVTGDFVFAVTEGYIIDGGKITKPVRGATLVGNGPKVLCLVDRVGNDLRFITGTCGKDGQGAPVTDAQPTMRVPELTVGGEVPMEKYWKLRGRRPDK